MQVQVSLTIELAATASLTQMEQQIQEVGQQAMRETLKQVIRHWEDQQQACPHCGAKQRRLEGTVRRVIATTFGRVAVPRRRFRGLGCGRRWCPANRLFAELKGGTVSRPRPRSSAAGRLFVAVSSSQHRAQAAQWRPDQCGGDSADIHSELRTTSQRSKRRRLVRQGGRREMEWNATWNDPLRSYLAPYDELIGDKRTRTTADRDDPRHHGSRKLDLPTDCRHRLFSLSLNTRERSGVTPGRTRFSFIRRSRPPTI